MRRLMWMVAMVATVAAAAACEGPPDDKHMQWVARDAWDSTCSDRAMVEKWVVTNGHWKIKDSVWVADVDATFNMTDDCTSGLPLVGKSYKTMQKATFKGTVEMSKCKKDGETGWALPGKEGSRCWTKPAPPGAAKVTPEGTPKAPDAQKPAEGTPK